MANYTVTLHNGKEINVAADSFEIRDGVSFTQGVELVAYFSNPQSVFKEND